MVGWLKQTNLSRPFNRRAVCQHSCFNASYVGNNGVNTNINDDNDDGKEEEIVLDRF